MKKGHLPILQHIFFQLPQKCPGRIPILICIGLRIRNSESRFRKTGSVRNILGTEDTHRSYGYKFEQILNIPKYIKTLCLYVCWRYRYARPWYMKPIYSTTYVYVSAICIYALDEKYVPIRTGAYFLCANTGTGTYRYFFKTKVLYRLQTSFSL